MTEQERYSHTELAPWCLTINTARLREAICEARDRIEEFEARVRMTPTLMAKVRVSSVTSHEHGLFKTVELRGIPMGERSALADLYSDQGQVMSFRVSDPVLLDQLRQGTVFSLTLTPTGEQTAPDPEG